MTRLVFKRTFHAVFMSAVVVSLIGLSGCAAAPTSTYTNAAGEEVTVSWKDYPLHGYSLPEEILAAPVKEDVEGISTAILDELKAVLAEEFQLQWTASGETGWYPNQGNGYGGKSMTTTFNSVQWDSDNAPVESSEWARILAIINRITTARGLGTMKLSPDADTVKNDPAWHEELVEKYGTADPHKLYWITGTAYADSQWFSVYLVNVDRDTTGKAAAEYEKSGFPPRTISLSYGATTVSRDDLPAFKDALAPFQGLTPPEPTTSD